MNSFIRNLFGPARDGAKRTAGTALSGLLLAGAIIVGGTMFAGGALVHSAHAWNCSPGPGCSTVTTIVNVVNTGGGTAVPSDFQLTITDESSGTYYGNSYSFAGSASGTSYNIDPEQYQVVVTSGPAHYTASYSSQCSASVAPGQTNTCTVTETYTGGSGGVCTVSGSLTDSVNNATPKVGDTIIYTLNNGSFSATAPTHITVIDQLGADLTFVSANPSIGTYSSSTGIWDVGMVSGALSGESLTITATVGAGAAGQTITNTPTINYPGSACTQSSAVSGNATITVQNVPTVQYADLAIMKTADVATTTPGGTVRYALTVTDLGPATSTGVVATDTLPSGLTFVSATTSEGSYASSTGTWTIGTLSASSSATLGITALVNASGTAGTTITNTAIVGNSTSTVDNNLSNNSSSVSVSVLAPTSTPSATIVATKIICPSANELPDLSGTGAHITSSTAAAFLATHPDCHAAAGWEFQWGNAYAADPGASFIGPATSTNWVAPFGPTNASGTATVSVPDPASYSQIWMREVLQNGYLAFSYPGTNSTNSPEMFCNTDVLNYDNYDRITAPQNGGTYYCVAWNVPLVTPTTTASYSIVKTVDNATPVAGATVHYTVTVGNIGSSTVNNAVATDTLPSGLTFVSATTSEGSYASSTGTWTIGTLTPNATATLEVATLVNATDTVGQAITNTATIASDTASVTLTVANGGTPTSTIANLAITKTVDNAAPQAGQTIDYTVVVDALGPATSTGVVATDTLPSGLAFVSATTSEGSYASSTGTWTIGDMTPSSTATLEIAALVDSSDPVGMQITNTAIVGESPSSTNTNTGASSSSVTITVTGGGGGGNDAALSVAKTANVTSTLPGGMIDYTITATAGGPNPSTGVVATDTLPSGLTFAHATASVGSYASSTGTWTIGTLAPNATATLEIAAQVNAVGTANTTIVNQATIGESPTLVNTSGNTTAQASVYVGTPTSTANTADLAIAKTVNNANPVTGSDVNFTVTVTNNGPDAATFVYANDQLPIGLALVNATTSASTTYSMGTGVWTIGTLAPNATATLEMETEVSALAGTQVTNTATVSSTLSSLIDPNPVNNSSSVTLNVQAPPCTSNCGGGGGGGGNIPTAQIAIAKTVDNAAPAPGAVIHYTLTATAEGPSASFGVVASDTLPAGVTFVAASSSLGSYDPATGQWTIGTLADGQSATLVITATVNAGDANGMQITNTGTIHEAPNLNSPLSGPMTSSVTITVGGTGGGGGGGQVLGASTSTGEVLGASCGLYLTSYIHPVRKDLNDPAQVKKLQVFLNQNLGLDLPVSGDYDASTIAAVNRFQVKYHTEVLSPWVPLGLPTQYTPTGYVYQSTQRWINLIMCPALNLPMPHLVVDNGGK